MLWRAGHGLSIEEQDILTFLVNAKDKRERTRLAEHDVYGHSVMVLLSQLHPYELGIYKDIADIEDTYFIALEGEQRKEMILVQRAKTEISYQGTPLTYSLPTLQTEQKPAEQPKKGLFRR
jgi:hypothetical protein